ncbi:MAG: hypothetical protein Q8P24_16465 [Desulfobacterales bacterium]|nr:hypothetical protein [Desulfobacterales bacterium]
MARDIQGCYGEYRARVTGKQIVLPPEICRYFQKIKPGKVYLMAGFDKCLFLFIEPFWPQSASELVCAAFDRNEKQMISASHRDPQIIECAQDACPDIPLSRALKDYAGIDSEIVIVGVDDRIEIWAKERWSRFVDEMV